MFQKVVFFLFICCFFTLSGCENKGGKSGLSDEEKARQEECEKKGSGWLWDVTKEECIVAPKTEEDCTVKGEGWLWDAGKNECKAPLASQLSNKEKCKAKGVGWTWDETNKQCNEENLYMTITIPTVLDNKFVDVRDNKFSDVDVIRYNKYLLFHWSDFKGSSFDSSPGECVKIHKSNLPRLVVHISSDKINLIQRHGYIEEKVIGRGGESVCYNSPDFNTPEERVTSAIFVDIPMCLVGNYTLIQKSDGKPILFPLSDAVDVDSCREYLRSN